MKATVLELPEHTSKPICEDQGVLEMPLVPTWARYKSIFVEQSDISIYRALEYEVLSSLDYSGRILDFGGGEHAHYVPGLRSWISDGEYESINISPDMAPTYLVKPGGEFPLRPGSFDMVLSVNTLEHVYDLNEVLQKLLTVLRPGGRIVFAVPFLYRVHGCPDDYNRPTASWWARTLIDMGVSELRIRPVVWDFMTSGLSITEGAGPVKRLRRLTVPLYGLLYGWLKARGKNRYPCAIGNALANMAVGYVITGLKR